MRSGPSPPLKQYPLGTRARNFVVGNGPLGTTSPRNTKTEYTEILCNGTIPGGTENNHHLVAEEGHPSALEGWGNMVMTV
jgi:hypothetical protein